MESRRTARIRRALGSSIPPKTARIICESTSLPSPDGRFCRNLCATPYQTVGFCELEPYCQALIKEKRPDTPLWPDIERLNDWLEKALTLYQVVFPARTSPVSGKARGYNTTEPPAKPQPVRDSGGNWLVPFAWYDRHGHIWRTWKTCSEKGWEPFLATWPPSGMTRNGIAYRRDLLEPATAVRASGLLPTPAASDWKGRYTLETVNRRAQESSRGVRLPEALVRRYHRTGRMNPRFVQQMMMYPRRWMKLKDSAMLSSLKSSNWLRVLQLLLTYCSI
jgi:hypothetical protein